ncbi:MAG: transglycosylase family protein [Solirubrobacteraceae bacterium]|jgi:septal ring factor EnvC (AmiA/AmiB activator)
MSSSRRTVYLRAAAAAATFLAAGAMAASMPLRSSADPSLGELHSQLGQVQAHQQSLAASVSSLSQTISTLDGQIALVQQREAIVRAQLVRDRVQLAGARVALARERRLLALLIARLAYARYLLSRQLVSSYEGDRPDLVSVVLEAHGFAELLDQLNFLHTAERQQQSIITLTRTAKAAAAAAARRLAQLEATDERITADAVLRARALAGMNALLAAKEAALQNARTAQQAALAAAQAKSRQLQASIARVEAEQAAAARAAAAAAARAAATAAAQADSGGGGGGGAGAPSNVGATYGASGGWAIPYPIVLCESGGQDLTPNSAGASGYYQIIPGTWQLFGGTGPAAYLASKAEQDAVAARIWNGGAGASNWVCAGIVGIH